RIHHGIKIPCFLRQLINKVANFSEIITPSLGKASFFLLCLSLKLIDFLKLVADFGAIIMIFSVEPL
ncbi:MAG: hypothetical protein L0G20_03625, partial [Lactobacillus sp.]|nr:hypothetical protein [Lactobacillus sp.]